MDKEKFYSTIYKIFVTISIVTILSLLMSGIARNQDVQGIAFRTFFMSLAILSVIWLLFEAMVGQIAGAVFAIVLIPNIIFTAIAFINPSFIDFFKSIPNPGFFKLMTVSMPIVVIRGILRRNNLQFWIIRRINGNR